MALDLDIGDIDTANIGGFTMLREGSYHFEVTSVAEDGNAKSADMLIDCEVLAGTDQSQVGLTHREFFGQPGTANSAEGRAIRIKLMLGFALAVKLTTIEELETCKKAGRSPRIDFNLALGRQFVGKVTHNEYEKEGKKKHNARMGFDIWALDNPKAAGVPLNAGKVGANGQAADPFGDKF